MNSAGVAQFLQRRFEFCALPLLLVPDLFEQASRSRIAIFGRLLREVGVHRDLPDLIIDRGSKVFSGIRSQADQIRFLGKKAGPVCVCNFLERLRQFPVFLQAGMRRIAQVSGLGKLQS